MASIDQRMPLPVPVIDHVVVNVRARMPEAVKLYSQLGFALTPEGRHTLGSINHLAMFGPDYLELLGVPPEASDRADVMEWPEGLSGIAFACEDAQAVHAALTAAGVPVLSPLAFSRPVDMPTGRADAAFRVVRLAPGATAAGRLFFCQHVSRGLVWRDEWRRHPNGALGVAGIVIGASQPETLGRLLGGIFGHDAVIVVPGGLRLPAGLSSIDVLEWAELRRRYGDAVPEPEGREAVMAVLVLRALSRDRVVAALRAGRVEGVQEAADRIIVPAAAAMGVALEFCPA